MASIFFKVFYGQLKKLVDMLDGTHIERSISYLEEGLAEGRQFRSFVEFSIPSGQSLVLKFDSQNDFILLSQLLSVDDGAVRFSAYVGATETAPFNTSLPIVRANRFAAAPVPAVTFSVKSGGTFTGGTVTDSFRVRAASATAQQATVGPVRAGERWLPAGVFYLKLENFGNSTATGNYALIVQQR